MLINKAFNRFLQGLYMLLVMMSLLAASPANAGMLPAEAVTNGEMVVSVWVDGQWKEVGSLCYDRFMREEQLELDTIFSEQSIMLKIVKKGGGAAHLDSVLLGGDKPLRVGGDAFLLKKLSAKDNDVINVDEAGIVVDFAPGAPGRMLSLTARVEGLVISKEPFKFPAANNYRDINSHSAFYSYTLGSSVKTLTIDGKPNEADGLSPLFKEYCIPGSGHPEGYTYGWVMNDSEYLYAVVDFTPDNTMDGDKDYSKLFVKTDNGVKEFKVSVPETSWGSPAFIYTDRVAYQHKVYEFKVPLSELGIDGFTQESKLSIAFSAYGTAALESYVAPRVAYDSVNSRYLAVYSKGMNSANEYYPRKITGRFFNINEGSSQNEAVADGDEFDIALGGNDLSYGEPKVKFNSITGRFLVLFSSYGTVHGQYIEYNSVNGKGKLVNHDGTAGVSFIISSDSARDGDLAYNSITGRFTIVWYRLSGGPARIQARTINENGVLQSEFNVDQTDGNDYDYQSLSAVSSPAGTLIAWTEWDNDDYKYNICCRIINGTDVSGKLQLQSAVYYINQDRVSYDSNSQRFLIVWAQDSEVKGQFVKLINGSPVKDGEEPFVVYNSSRTVAAVDVDYDKFLKNFTVAWKETGSTNSSFKIAYVDYMKAGYVEIPETFAVDTLSSQYNISVACGSSGKALVSTTASTGYSDIPTIINTAVGQAKLTGTAAFTFNKYSTPSIGVTIPVNFGSTEFEGIKNGSTPLSAESYRCDSSSITIESSYLSGFTSGSQLELTAEFAGYDPVFTINISGPRVLIQSVAYSKSSGKNLTLDMELHGKTLSAVRIGSTQLDFGLKDSVKSFNTSGVGYRKYGSRAAVEIAGSSLSGLAVSSTPYQVLFKFSSEDVSILQLTITD